MVNLNEATLLVVGHGSTVNVDSALPARLHAENLAGRGIFREVMACYWKQEPKIAEVVAKVTTKLLFVVPLFISEGYFTQQMIPRELGMSDGVALNFPRLQAIGGREIHYCGPIGTHPRMTDLLLKRARAIVEQFPFPHAPLPSAISLFIAGHGTGNNENSRRAIEDQVEKLRALHCYASVHAIYIEEEPRIAACYELAVARNIVVVPFFISDGMHTDEDIPVFLGEAESIVKSRRASGQPAWRNPSEKRGKRVWYSTSIGTDPLVAEIILERVREATSA